MIRLVNVSRVFGKRDAVQAGTGAGIHDINLEIKAGEFFCLLGPSGCGKTTLLRILAGLEQPDSGSVEIDGMDMGGVDPADRPVNIMFQNYALFPHYSVAQNIAYGLKRAGMRGADLQNRIGAMLEMVRLTGYGDRMPASLSGGERQRVALARALARKPKVLLLDEPLAALDKKLREESRFELVNIQGELGTTFVVVTHDQEEAMVLADRIGVMQKGRLIQKGAPKTLYENPQSRFVAGFLGSVSVLRGVVQKVGAKTLTLDVAGATITAQRPTDEVKASVKVGQTITIAIRPEKIALQKAKPKGGNYFRVQVDDIAFTGVASAYRVHVLAKAQTTDITLNIHQQNLRDEDDLTWDEKAYACFAPDSVIVLPD